jgi:hypothetical protein
MREAVLGIARISLVSILSFLIACATSSAAPDEETNNQLAPEEPSAAGDPCELMIRFNRRCTAKGAGASAACADARREQCDAERASQSEAYASAIRACVDESTPCSANVAGCIVDKLSVATLTGAQEAVRDAYCDRCNTSNASCARDFFLEAGGRVEPNAGPGFLLLTVSDELNTEIKKSCVNQLAPPGCSTFGACLDRNLFRALPSAPEACLNAPD